MADLIPIEKLPYCPSVTQMSSFLGAFFHPGVCHLVTWETAFRCSFHVAIYVQFTVALCDNDECELSPGRVLFRMKNDVLALLQMPCIVLATSNTQWQVTLCGRSDTALNVLLEG